MKKNNIGFWKSIGYVEFLYKRKIEENNMSKLLSDMKVGSYDIRIVKKGIETTQLPVKEGGVYYIVRVENNSWIDVLSLFEAEMLSRQVRIEISLRKIIKEINYSDNELKGKQAVKFVKEMHKTQNRKPNKVEKFFMDGLK